MKQVLIFFEDKEHGMLLEEKNKKGKQSWHDFVLSLIKNVKKGGN